ncbi:MAG: nicotinate phosphoribosyltransferase [Candidatus Woesearchaeota archaeon]
MIITSLLDTDFYKLTMMQAIYHKYTDVYVDYAFKWRNWDNMILNDDVYDFINKIDKEIDNLCQLKFKPTELQYLESIPFIKRDFVDFLRLFKLNRDHIKVYEKHGKPQIRISGPWLNTILFEVPVLAIVSELYTRNFDDMEKIKNVAISRLLNKIDYINRKAPPYFKYGDFGTRRRATKEFQDLMIHNHLTYLFDNNLIGTSNVYFAKKYNIKPLGTHAHEWFQGHQQLNTRLINSQRDALQSWADEYRGELGIALSDCITFDAFLKDFDKYFAKLFDGCRHDSGDPFEWTDKLIDHYNKLKIDPKTKTALYSDGLNLERALTLYKKYSNKINTSFGIGTYLTNDCGFEAPQIVIKMVNCNNLPVAKISDSKGKGMCEDIEFENYLKKVINQKLNY